VLPWLGDIFAWPAPMPLANTFSVGDILIVLGVFVAAWSGTRRLGDASTPSAAPVAQRVPEVAPPTVWYPEPLRSDAERP